MNELIVKWLAASTVGLVVSSALWLAASVQTAQRGGWQNSRPAGFAAGKTPVAPLRLVAALPAQHAASGAVTGRAHVTLR